jgi:drug/metabolite transporter (DMT)-like permease
MNTNTLGIVTIIIGAIMIFYTGFNYVTTKKVIDIGPIVINRKQSHPVQWSPIVGVVLLIGGVLLVVRDKKS